MEAYLIVILWTAALFAAVLVNFAVQSKYVIRLLGAAAVVTGIGGILIYGYGYAATESDSTLAVLKALFAACRMFIGENCYEDIAAAPAFRQPAMQILFWILHIFGLFSSVGAVISTLGADLLRRVRLLLRRRGRLAIIYGVTPDSLSFAQQLTARGDTSVVFIDDQPAAGCAETIPDMGCVLRGDQEAMDAGPALLRSLGIRPGKRPVALYALMADPLKNQQYAAALCRSLQKQGIRPEQTALTILSEEPDSASLFQALDGCYGYGSTITVNTAELAARLLIRQYPPCDFLSFDEAGRAKEDFHALIVGFGQIGQAVLRHLVMNGQFEGSHFRAAVFAPDPGQMSGYLSHSCREMLARYDIEFHPQDGRSRQMFDYLSEHAASIQYIVICTGSEKCNTEIEQQLRRFLTSLHRAPLICCCDHHTVSRQVSPGQFDQHAIFSPHILCSQAMDRTAMVLNHTYCRDTSRTAWENWLRCDSFSRMSSRASADFAPAFLRAAGTDEKAVLEGSWNPQGALLENLAKTEHLRWCAFHYAMGFSPMDGETFQRRADAYLAEKAQTGSSKLRIGKDMENKRHACLVPWEELDALSEKENAVTGGSVDYKRYDRDNVLALAGLIRAAADDTI